MEHTHNACHGDATTQKLLRAFMQFKKTDWHGHIVAGCKPSEIRALICIKRGALPGTTDIKVSEISRLLQVTSPTITQILKGLETQGLIERHVDPNDRRAVGISLTEQGEMVTQKAMEAFHASFQGLSEYLGEEESNQLAELLLKVNRYYSEKVSHLNNQSLWNGGHLEYD